MFIGVASALIATLCFAAGNIFEKRAVDRLPPFSLRRLAQVALSLVTSGWWLAGAALSGLGLLAQVLAFSHTAISIVQSVGVAGIVLLVAVSRLHLGERLERWELVGLALAVVSLVFVSLSLTPAADSAGEHGAIGAALVAALCTLGAVLLALATPALRRDERGIVYGVLAGLLYGISGLGAKGLSTLLARHGWLGTLRQIFESPFLYVFLGGWVLGLAVFQAGIQRCRVGVVAPLSTMVGSAYIVGVGTPIFGEHLPADPVLLLFRLLGFAGIVVGSTLMGLRSTSSTPVAGSSATAEVAGRNSSA